MHDQTEDCDWHVIEHPEAARILDDPHKSRFLHPFLEHEVTVSEAARTLGVNALTMYRRVKRLEAHGLLHVARTTRRAGKAINHYRAIAARFFVPFSILPNTDFEGEWLEQDDFWRQLLANGLASVARDAMRDEGVFIYRAHGGIRKRQGSFPGKPATPTTANTAPTWSDSSAVKLAPEDALALQLEMRALFERYVHKNSARGRFFVMRTALAPITDDDVPSIPR